MAHDEQVLYFTSNPEVRAGESQPPPGGFEQDINDMAAVVDSMEDLKQRFRLAG